MRTCALGLLLVVTALSLMASFSPRNPLMLFVGGISGGDTVAHFGLLGSTALALTLAFTKPARRLHWRQLVPAALLLLAATGDEFAQLGIRTRTFSHSDLAANTAGIVLFTALALAGRGRPAETSGKPSHQTRSPA